MPDDRAVRDLIAEARAEPGASRLERFRDRVAAHGSAAVAPLAELRDDPVLPFFAVVVLERLALGSVPESSATLRDFASSASDASVRRLAGQAAQRVVGRRTPPAPRPTPGIDPPVVLRRPATATPSRPDQMARVRRLRGEPELDESELTQAIASLAHWKDDPRRYINRCWLCKVGVDQAENLRCDKCRWLVCWCGACRDPMFRGDGLLGPCRRETWALWEAVQKDIDYNGLPIMTSAPPVADAPAMAELLESTRTDFAYHWTPLRGIASILRHGILSRSLLHSHHVEFVPHVLGDAAKRVLLSEFVALSLRTKPLMMEKWSRSPIVLSVDSEVLTATGTLFVPGNSASPSFPAQELMSYTGLGSLAALYEPTGSIVGQAEVWVPTRVPSSAIREVHVRDVELAALVETAVQQHVPASLAIPVIVSPNMFLVPDLRS
jgi:ssDNA thymidine ADP-ribosyltransferase DarT-like protein